MKYDFFWGGPFSQWWHSEFEVGGTKLNGGNQNE